MNLVWKHYQRGGSEKLALLALADFCDDVGGSLFPSISTVAKRICLSNSQARRIIHGFIDDGLLDVIGNHFGGAKGQSRQYRLNLEKLTFTPSADATPSMDATPSADARYPLHGCALPLAPMQANPLLTIKELPQADSKHKRASEVIDYLNEKARRRFPKSATNLKLITARLEDPATVEECKAVIDLKVREWLGDIKWDKYLRPSTLFGATNFSQYVGQIGDTSANSGDQQWE
jgi:uncharacterized phage protein (TIGR02220 family)